MEDMLETGSNVAVIVYVLYTIGKVIIALL
jgi:hypothetical protein